MILSIIPMLFTLMWGNSAQLTIDTSTVEGFDIENYLGTWYEIARYDNRFERNLDYVSAQYTMMPNRHIEVINRGYNTRTNRWQESDGKAKLTDTSGALRVCFFLWFYNDYNVMELCDDYSWALVGSSSPEFLWILSRERELTPQTLEHICNLATERGYDTSLLIYPKQI